MIRGLLFVFLLLGEFALAHPNQMARFTIRQCSPGGCVIAKGRDAFLNFNGRLISARDISLKILKRGANRTYRCLDFRADLKLDRYVCDNRDARGRSLTVDDGLQVTMY